MSEAVVPGAFALKSDVPVSGVGGCRIAAAADLYFYFAPPPVGDNANPGTLEAPKADPVAIYNMVRADYDLKGQFKAFAIGSGVYSSPVHWEFRGPLPHAENEDGFIIKGSAPSNPNSLQFTGSADYGVYVHKGATVTFENVSAVATPGGNLFLVGGLSALQVRAAYVTTNNANSIFDACGPGAMLGADGILVYSAPNTGCKFVAVCEDNGGLYLSGQWQMAAPGPAFETFANADLGGIIDCTTFRYSGPSGNGRRAMASTGGIVFTNGMGQGALPGSFNGTPDSGGVIQ